MIRSFYITADGQLHSDLSLSDYTAALQDPSGLLWVDFEETPSETDEPVLREVFHFHPLAIDDALQETHVPKVDDWESFLYIVLHAVVFSRNNGNLLDTHELDIFLGKNYIVTHHDQKIPALDKVWLSCQREERHWKYGSDHILYRITDEIVGSYMPVVEALDDEIDEIEDKIFSHPDATTIEYIFSLKRAVIHLRRVIAPQREVLNKLARDDYDVVDEKARVYFRDVYDHLVRLHDVSESLRDLVGGVLDTYLSVVNNRMNEVMKILTVITTLFMPISFITGFFGMNFFQPMATELAHWTDLLPFLFMMMIVIFVPVGMLIWMQRRRWM